MCCTTSFRATINYLYLISGQIIYTCNSIIEEAEAVGSPVQDLSVLHCKFRASLGHSKTLISKKKQNRARDVAKW